MIGNVNDHEGEANLALARTSPSSTTWRGWGGGRNPEVIGAFFTWIKSEFGKKKRVLDLVESQHQVPSPVQGGVWATWVKNIAGEESKWCFWIFYMDADRKDLYTALRDVSRLWKKRQSPGWVSQTTGSPSRRVIWSSASWLWRWSKDQKIKRLNVSNVLNILLYQDWQRHWWCFGYFCHLLHCACGNTGQVASPSMNLSSTSS